MRYWVWIHSQDRVDKLDKDDLMALRGEVSASKSKSYGFALAYC